MDFIFDINELIYILSINFILSYFITTLTTNGHLIGDIAYDSLWYQLPNNEQFIVQMIIRRAQKPFTLNALGVFSCSLETFLTVIYSEYTAKLKRIFLYLIFLLFYEIGLLYS